MIQFQGNKYLGKWIQNEGHMEGQIYGQTLFHRTLPAADRGPNNNMIDIIYWAVLQHMSKTFKEILQAPV